jgi:Fe2+ transport system protein FeoA
MSLASVPFSKPVRVTGIRGGGPLAYRLMEMGLIEGAQIEVLGCAPLGDPLHVRLGDYDLSLRSEDAERIDVTEP